MFDLTKEEKQLLYKMHCGSEFQFFSESHKLTISPILSDLVVDSQYSTTDEYLTITLFLRNDISFYLEVVKALKNITSIMIDEQFYKIFKFNNLNVSKDAQGYYFIRVGYNIE